MSTGLLLAVALTASTPLGGVLPGETAAYDAMLASAARAANDSFAGSPCPDARVEVLSISPVRIADQPKLVAWREKVRVSGCGKSVVQNVNIGRVGGSPPWRMSTGLPGESLADINLQASTFQAAAAQARTGLEAGCQSLSLDEVYLAALPGGVDVSPPGVPAPQPRAGRPAIGLPETYRPMLGKLALSDAWMEVWPFTICGNDRTLGVVFIPLKDQSASAYLFLPVWQMIRENGPDARPAAVPPPK